MRISDLFCCCSDCRLPDAVSPPRVEGQIECFLGPLLDANCVPVNPPERGMALPRAKNLAFMFVRYRFSMALCAAFLRFMTAAASVSCESTERADLVFDDVLEEADDLGEASGEEGEEVEDDVDALEGFRGLVRVVFSVCC